MEKTFIFIIEDNREDYLQIKNNILPPNDYASLLDIDGGCELSKEEEKAINLFSENQTDSLKKSIDFIINTIIKHQDKLRMIICDLKINGRNDGGNRIIGAIRNNKTIESQWFAKNIPILILSHLTLKWMTETASKHMSGWYFPKKTAFNSADVIINVISHLASDFDSRYKKQKSIKEYKVALSFAGSTTDENGDEVILRDFVEDVARELYSEYSKDKVFYDLDKMRKTISRTPKEFARKIYNDSEYCVVFLSKKYVDKISIWTTEEWEVIKNLVQERRVLFMKLDNTIRSDDFKEKMGIEVRLYDDMTLYCSNYNGITQGGKEDIKSYLYKTIENKPITKIGEEIGKLAIQNYKSMLRHEIVEAAKKIIDYIQELDREREL